MDALSARIRTTLWWLLPLAALFVIIGLETRWGRALDRRPELAEPIAPKPVVASLLPEYAIVGGVAGHNEMVQRTLFNPTRRPAPAAPVAAAGTLQRGQFALTGTMIVDGKHTAFLREVAGNKPRRVLAGDNVNGMLVAEVKPDRVKLTLGDESEELLLRVGTNPRPTAPPAAPPVAAAPQAPVVPQTAPGPRLPAPRRRRPSPSGAAPPGPPRTPLHRRRPAPHRSAPAAVDPRWNQMDQAYRDRAAMGGRAATQ
jgi:hypothetical protein